MGEETVTEQSSQNEFEQELERYRRVLLPTTREERVITAARGAEVKVRSAEGERWVIDGTSQVGTNPLGHRHPELLEAMRKFSDSSAPLMIAGNDSFHPLQRELAEKFTDIYPGGQSLGDVKVYFCNSGSEAVERGCLKAAALHRGGNTYVGFHNAFHGRTSLALSCNFSKGRHTEGFNSLSRVLPVPFADREWDTGTCLDLLEKTIVREGSGNVNAVIIEPIQGEGGYVTPRDGFLEGVREVTREHGIPLIVDEVQTALRTGHWFASEHWGVESDMVPVAKAFSGGVAPFGAALIKDEFATEERGKQSNTFGGNPKECLAALKTIEIIEENDLLRNARRLGKRLGKVLDEVEGHDAVAEVRGLGLMWGVEFRNHGDRDDALRHLYREGGVMTEKCGNARYNPAVRFLLPVNVEKEVVDHVAEATVRAVDAL